MVLEELLETFLSQRMMEDLLQDFECQRHDVRAGFRRRK
jgi:hypothetical protein